jgi:hypothetical protein
MNIIFIFECKNHKVLIKMHVLLIKFELSRLKIC